MRRSLLVAVGVWMCVVSMTVAAAGAESADRTLSPYFWIEDADEGLDCFPLKLTTVAVTISGVVADVWVTQAYANQGTRPINARYVFPASVRAAVHGMRLIVGEDVITARIKERRAAQKVFKAATSAGKSASLLEQQRPNVFTMSVANIMPGETVSVELHYSELLVPEEGMYEFVYPTVVGPRYSTIAEEGAADHQQWLKNPYLKEDHEPAGQFNSKFKLWITLTSGLPIQQVACSSHTTEVTWEGEYQAQVALSPDEAQGGDRDFILQYRLAGDRIQSGLMIHQGADENFFMLMVQPPRRVVPESLPPREYIFVLDVSGSMHGFPLDTARVLMKQLLAGLGPGDRFNVILFSGASRVLAPRSVPAGAAQIQAALQLIDEQQGGGGTELARALKTGLALPRAENCARTMVVVTDGYIAAEKEAFGLVADSAGQCNIFAFGIGSSVNRYLIEGLARAGQGEPFVVTDPGAAAATAARFKKYIEAPVLTGIEVDYGEFGAYDIEPARVVDLFAARPLIICGKWRGPLQGSIQVKGTTGAEPYTGVFDLKQTIASENTSALPYLWVRQRLGRLSDFSVQPDDDRVRQQVTDLGLRYAMLTPYTSFVAVHEAVRNTMAPAQKVDQPLPLPLHVSNLAVGGRNVPEPEISLMLTIMIIAGLLAAWRRAYKRGLGAV